MTRYTKGQTTLMLGNETAACPLTENSLGHDGPSTLNQSSRWSTAKSAKRVCPGKSSPRSSSPEEAPLLGSVDTHNHKESSDSDQGTRGRSRSLSHESHASFPPGRVKQPGCPSILVSVLLTVLSFILVAVAPVIFHFRDHDLAENQYCVNSVLFASNSLSFSDTNGSYWSNLCHNSPRLITILASAKVYCSPAHISPGFKPIKDDCWKHAGLKMVDIEPIGKEITPEYISRLQVVDEEMGGAEVLREPVLISEPFFDRVFRTIDTWYRTTKSHHAYGFALQAFWVAILISGIICKIGSTFLSRHGGSYNVENDRDIARKAGSRKLSTHLARVTHWFRAYVTTPAAIGTHHQRLLHWCTIPSRSDAIVVCAFWVLSITLSCISYEPFPENYL